ncbi:MAG: sodium:alanine symporter family protein [Ruminococcus sp.]|nr:sodium:alanine symporter family protein [Ruminococcus sp.]
MSSFIETINGYLWGLPMIAFLFLTHILMSVRTGFIQRKVFKGIRLSLGKDKSTKDGISPFSALATTLASTLGTGNIIGVSTAVALGGAGAVFWCWLTGLLGMATQYCECVLSVIFREKDSKGEYQGGPMYVLKNGVGSKALGRVYASLAAVAGLITGAAIQTNAIKETVLESVISRNKEFDDPSVISLCAGTVVAVLTALVIFGGLKSVATVCSMVVPFMAVAYTLGCLLILLINRELVCESFVLIIKDAFSLKSATGGFMGSALMLSCRYGVSRGLFSNEAGIGTSSVICANANTDLPAKQGLISMTATFWDTVVMCLITGLAVVSTGLCCDVSDTQGAMLCMTAFSRIPYVGKGVLVFSMIAFAFSTILGWSAIGEKFIVFLLGEKAAKPYRAFWVMTIFISSFVSLEGIWALGDLINGILVVPNVAGLLLLSGKVRDITRSEKGIGA